MDPFDGTLQVGSSLESRLSYLATRRYRITPHRARDLARATLASSGSGPELVRVLREKCRGLAPRPDGVRGGCRILGHLAGLSEREQEALWLVLRNPPRTFC